MRRYSPPVEIVPDSGSPAFFAAHIRVGISHRRRRMLNVPRSTSAQVVAEHVWKLYKSAPVLIFMRPT